MPSMLYNMENLAACKLTASLTTSATTVTVDDTTGFPQGTFRATLVPASEMSRKSNSEIVLCDVISSTSIGITRAQGGTTAKAFNAGDILVNGIYIEDLKQVQSVGDTIFEATGTTDGNGVVHYTISTNNDLLPAIPTEGMRITIMPATSTVDNVAPVLALQSGGAEVQILTGSVILGEETFSPAQFTTNTTYELVYDGAYWYATNLSPKVKSNNIDWTTIRTRLYSGTFNSGSTDLNDNISNYDFIEVYGITNDSENIFTKFVPPSAGTAITAELLGAHRAGSTDYYIKHASFKFQNATMSLVQQGEQKTNTNNSASSSNNVSVTSVWGIKM